MDSYKSTFRDTSNRIRNAEIKGFRKIQEERAAIGGNEAYDKMDKELKELKERLAKAETAKQALANLFSGHGIPAPTFTKGNEKDDEYDDEDYYYDYDEEEDYYNYSGDEESSDEVFDSFKEDLEDEDLTETTETTDSEVAEEEDGDAPKT